MTTEEEYLELIGDTAKIIANKKATALGDMCTAYRNRDSVGVMSEKIGKLGNAANAFQTSGRLANDVEFWKWMGANYPKNLGNSQIIQQTASEKSRWLLTQLQGKGYEWDYMTLQRGKLSNVLSKFNAGDCPTQPGIDITKTSLKGSVQTTYQNKAYLSSNNPNLKNTPKDTIVVTNKEKVAYAQKQGYQTEKFMDADEIKSVRDTRFKQAQNGKAGATYTLKNVADVSAKAGIFGAVIGIATEAISSYHAWKNGELTNEQYLKEVLKAGGDGGITGAATAAIMVPVKSTIIVAGASSIIGIPVAIVLGAAVSKIVAPCFGRGDYRKILNEAKYYQALEDVYDDFLVEAAKSADMFVDYVENMSAQNQKYEQLKLVSGKMNKSLSDLYDLI